MLLAAHPAAGQHVVLAAINDVLQNAKGLPASWLPLCGAIRGVSVPLWCLWPTPGCCRAAGASVGQWVVVQQPVAEAGGSNTPIWDWLHFGDRALAPFCRSAGGAYMPITESLQYAVL